MRIITRDANDIRDNFDIDEVEDAFWRILSKEGLSNILTYATQKRPCAKGKFIRAQIVEQMAIADAWGGGHTLPQQIQHIVSRCLHLDEFAYDDPMKGRYIHAAPFLVILDICSNFPVWDCLEGKRNLKNIRIKEEDGHEVIEFYSSI